MCFSFYKIRLVLWNVGLRSPCGPVGRKFPLLVVDHGPQDLQTLYVQLVQLHTRMLRDPLFLQGYTVQI